MIARAAAIAACLVASRAPARAAGEPASGAVDPVSGAASHAIAIQVPRFFGLEPRLALTYGSQSPNGLVGVGWSLRAASVVERISAGGGAPRYDATDVYALDGQELMPCSAQTASASCRAGGTHTALIEDFRKIVFEPGANRWSVWTPDGVVTRLTPVLVTAAGTFRWGQTLQRDPSGNQVDTSWWCDGADECYVERIGFGSSELRLHREPRPDPMSFATGASIATVRHRLRSVVLREGGALVRAYRLTYETSPWSGRSRLIAAQTVGRDAAVDAAGAITGGTAAPAETFTYADDPAGPGLTLSEPPAPTAPTAREPVAWFKQACAAVTSTTLVKAVQPGCSSIDWNGGASSTRAIHAGDGYVEFRFAQWRGATAAGLGVDDLELAVADIELGVQRDGDGNVAVVEHGVEVLALPASCCALYRIAVEGGHMRVYQDGVLRYQSPRAPSYPLRLDVSMAEPAWSGVADAAISGGLVDVALWCHDGQRHTGDFDGDGRGDLLCDRAPAGYGTRLDVRLGTATGFGPAATWLEAGANQRGLGDFDGDGKLDLWLFDDFTGELRVARSTGAAFAAPAAWGGNGVCRVDPGLFRWRSGDFNGDGRTDLACQRVALNGNLDGVWVGLSTGTSFSHARWTEACDAATDLVSAADFDGDGRTDWQCTHPNGAVTVLIARGAAFAGGFGVAGGACQAEAWLRSDWNGDGKTDLVCRTTGDVRLSTGRQLVPAGSIGGFCLGTGDEVVTADVNGDGMLDWLCNRRGAPADDLIVRPGTAAGPGPAQVWNGGWCPGRLTALDFDGDRKDDVLCDEAPRPVGQAGTPGRLADLVVELHNGLGGVEHLEYLPSSRFVHQNNPPVLYVTSRRTITDGRGGTSATVYAYAGGLHDRRARRFLGFRWIRDQLPCIAGEDTCPWRETWYFQDHGSRGARPERIDTYAGDGRLLTSTIDEIATSGAAPPYLTHVTGTWRFDYAASGPGCPQWPCAHGKRTYARFAYDDWGNLVVARYHGDHDAAGDENRIERVFRAAPAAFLTDRVAADTEYAAIDGGPILRQAVFHYDGAATWDAPPALGRMTARRDLDDSAGIFVEQRWTYDAHGNVLTEVDRNGYLTRHDWDPAGRFELRTTNALGHVTEQQWDAVCDARSRLVDPNGATTTTTRDALCRVTRTDTPGGGFTATTYPKALDPEDQALLVEQPGPAGAGPLWSRVYFDGLGRSYRVERRGPASDDLIASEVRYDARGNVAARALPRYRSEAARWTEDRHDALGRLVRRTLPDGTFVAQLHGAWLTHSTDPGGHTTTTKRDASGRLAARIEYIDGASAITSYRHERFGLVRITDPSGNAWTRTYDSLGRVRTLGDPDRGTTTFTPDPAGNVLAQVDALGQRTVMTYDALGRLATRTLRAGTPAAETATWRYDEPHAGAGKGRVTSSSDSAGAHQTDYDLAGRTIASRRTIGGVTYTTTLAYDAGGRVTSIRYPDGDTLGTADAPIRYDGSGRTISLPGYVTSATYTAAGALTSVVAANGVRETIEHDGRDLPRRIRAEHAGTAFLDLAYTYDAERRITAIVSPEPNDHWTYGYDAQHRLIQATSGNPALSESFTYDVLGNLTWTSRVGAMTYPAPGAPRPHAPTTLDAAAAVHDGAGQLVSGGGHAATWNGAHLPTALDGEFHTYGGNDRRVLSGADPTTPAVIRIGDLYEIRDGIATKYIKLGERLVGKRTGASRFFLHTDHLGSIRAITNAAGEVVVRKHYRPYGDEVESRSARHVEPRGYLGQPRDASGLLYLGARVYDPVHGRFLSPDDAAPELPGVGTNRYAYAGGDPINRSDPTGRMFPICVRRGEDGWCLEVFWTNEYVEVRPDPPRPPPTDSPYSHPTPPEPPEPTESPRGGGGGGGGGTGGTGGGTGGTDDGSTDDPGTEDDPGTNTEDTSNGGRRGGSRDERGTVLKWVSAGGKPTSIGQKVEITINVVSGYYGIYSAVQGMFGQVVVTGAGRWIRGQGRDVLGDLLDINIPSIAEVVDDLLPDQHRCTPRSCPHHPEAWSGGAD